MADEGTIVRVCKDCEQEFEISAGEQDFYNQRGWELPKRCKACRDKRKNARKSKNSEKE